MNRTLLISAAVALAVSGSVFARESASTQQFTESDCNMLTVDSARSSCMRSIHGSGSSHMGVGGTSGSGEGMTGGSGHGKRMHHKRSKHRAASDAQHQADKANGNQ